MDIHPIEPRPGRLKVILRALSHRNYRLFFFGQSVSLLGTWMQQIAMNWLVYHLTQSALMLGVVGFMGTVPLLLVGPFAGVWADRWDRRRTLLFTQGLLMLEALLLAVLALTGVIEVWHILVLSGCSGFVTALDGATRSAFLAEMVETRGDLGSAIALSSFIQYGARMLGPPLAGVLIAMVGNDGGVVTGTGLCFLLNGLSYLAVCAALWAMRVAPVVSRLSAHGAILRELQEGLAYAFRSPPIRDLLLIQALASLIGVPYSLMPVVAQDMLHGGPNTLGLLMGFTGFGALAGSVFLAARQGLHGTLERIALAGIVLGLASIGFSFAGELWLALSLRSAIGFTMMVTAVSGFTLLQTIVADDKRGRVISLYMLASWGMAPLGSLLLGSLADEISIARTFLVSGACCLAGFLWFAAQLPALRPLVEPPSPEGEAALAHTLTPPILSDSHHA